MLIDNKVKSNKEIFEILDKLEKEGEKEKDSYIIIIKDYRTEEAITSFELKGTFEQVLNDCSKLTHKHILSNKEEKIIELYN